jgi:protein-S-isoprenylcysteine O-methyltransferase Ste14
MIIRTLALTYGLFALLLFSGISIYFVGFIGNFLVPKTVETGEFIGLIPALLIDILLIALFGIQHSVMARQSFKQWWLKIVPMPIERSTYVLIASLMLGLLCWQWQPIPIVIWQVDNVIGYGLLYGLFAFGWLFSHYASALVNPFDLFGVRQVYLYWRKIPYTPVAFREIAVYKYIRHPIMLGIIIGLWATPLMTVGHLLLALGFTIYIFIGIYYEEKDMREIHGEFYEKYRQKTSMVMPFI